MEKIYIVSDKRDMFYDLTHLVPEMAEVEEITEHHAIQYFMACLEGDRYRRFPVLTPTSVIRKWIMEGED